MDAKEQRERQQREVDANYEVFRAQFAELYRKHPGKIALMKNTEVVEVFDTDSDALKYARRVFDDGFFSLQKIDNRPLRLGWMGYALLNGANN